MSACWLVEVLAWPITAEDTSKLISDLENKLHCNWSVRSYMLVNSGPFAFFERSPLEKWFPRPGKWIWKSSASTLAYVPMIFRYFNQYPFIYWVKNRISHIFPSPGGLPFLTVFLTIKLARLLSPRKSLHIFETNILVEWFNHIHYKKHRKNCEWCPGHYLIVDHYSSI